jgi:hypothetical protein
MAEQARPAWQSSRPDSMTGWKGSVLTGGLCCHDMEDFEAGPTSLGPSILAASGVMALSPGGPAGGAGSQPEVWPEIIDIISIHDEAGAPAQGLNVAFTVPDAGVVTEESSAYSGEGKPEGTSADGTVRAGYHEDTTRHWPGLGRVS